MDLKTAEMYIAAVLSQDKALMKVFQGGGNFHSSIAKKVFSLTCPVEEVAEKHAALRQAAKAVSFGILYGASKYKIAYTVTKDLGKSFSPEEAQDVIDDYFSAFPRLKKWIDENINDIKRKAYTYSYFGRKRRLPNVYSSDGGVSGHSVRSGLNFLIQSPSSDINLLGAMDASASIRATGLDVYIFALVHDSIIAEVKDEHIEDYKKILKNFFLFLFNFLLVLQVLE
jgi:DNA polymerase I-like protein with 3'-5' exonuclease and polymerase domains